MSRDLLKDNAQLRAKLEVATAAMQAAINKAEWQARTNGELNALSAENEKLRGLLRNCLDCAGRSHE